MAAVKQARELDKWAQSPLLSLASIAPDRNRALIVRRAGAAHGITYPSSDDTLWGCRVEGQAERFRHGCSSASTRRDRRTHA